jgi:hypothetical protein
MRFVSLSVAVLIALFAGACGEQAADDTADSTAVVVDTAVVEVVVDTAVVEVIDTLVVVDSALVEVVDSLVVVDSAAVVV